jgi:lysophospholipase L1-like esterase
MTARGRLLSGLVAMVIALAGFVTVGAPTAAAGPTGTLQYVALGDSYAAGVGAPPYDLDEACGRSSKGYPALLDPKGRIDLLDNVTCAGATTFTVASTQLSALTPDVELVTLTVGGNDLGFAGLAGACLAGTPAECQAAIQSALLLLPATCRAESKLATRLEPLYAAVDAAASSNALIVVTGYPYLFELLPGDPDLAIKTQINAATTLLNCAIENAVTDAKADGVNIVYVDVTAQFEGHGISTSDDSDDPFINSPSVGLPEAFHPNAAGYRAYAKAISTAIRDALAKQEQLA